MVSLVPLIGGRGRKGTVTGLMEEVGVGTGGRRIGDPERVCIGSLIGWGSDHRTDSFVSCNVSGTAGSSFS